MPFTVHIAEADAVRRLAGSLVTARAAHVAGPAPGRPVLDAGLSTRMYFLRFPWTGRLSESSTLPDFRTATVGQYLLAFDWEGHTSARATSPQESGRDDSPVIEIPLVLPSAPPPPQGKVTLESFFSDYFGD